MTIVYTSRYLELALWNLVKDQFSTLDNVGEFTYKFLHCIVAVPDPQELTRSFLVSFVQSKPMLFFEVFLQMIRSVFLK